MKKKCYGLQNDWFVHRNFAKFNNRSTCLIGSKQVKAELCIKIL